MTTSTTPPVLLIAASPSLRSRSGALLAGAAERLHHHGLSTRTLRLRELPAQSLLHADVDDPAIRDALAAVAEARVVVLATPIYKAAYSGLLKVFLDLLPQDGLAGKLVLPVATGGSQSHMLALDYALRPVLSSLNPRHVLPSIYATEAQVTWSEELGLQLDAPIAARVDEGVAQLSASLLAQRQMAPETLREVPFSQVRCSV